MSDDLRLLGHRDGVVHALLALRQEIGSMTFHQPIPKRHVRRLEERAKILAPLYRIQGQLEKQRNDIIRALDETRTKP